MLKDLKLSMLIAIFIIDGIDLVNEGKKIFSNQ